MGVLLRVIRMNGQIPPKTVSVAIIGGGFGALMSYAVLRFRGIPASQIAIFSPDSSPEHSWERFIRAINLEHLRSESTGHFYPTDSPGLATMEAFRMWSIQPIIQSWFDRYHPAVDTFIRHTKSIARQTGYYRCLTPTTISKIERHDGWFSLYDASGSFLLFAQHVIVAIGHGKHRICKPVERFRATLPHDTRVVLSYEHKSYAPPRRVVVVGDGLTAGTEWMNILQTGGSVVAVSLRGFSFGQALNCPRKYLSRRGLTPYRAQSAEDRIAEIEQATRGTVPMYPHWRRTVRDAIKSGRLEFITGELTDVQPVADTNVRCTIALGGTMGSRIIESDQLLCAIGFLPPATNPFLAQLIEQYSIPTMHGFPVIDNNCSAPEVSQPHSALFFIGSAAAWAFPCADQLSGLKLAARAIADRIVGKESWSFTEIAARIRNWGILVMGKELD